MLPARDPEVGSNSGELSLLHRIQISLSTRKRGFNRTINQGTGGDTMKMEWIPINEKTIETLQDRYYYLVAHNDYKTPLKAKFYKDLTPYFKVCSFNGVFVTYIFSEEDNEITHVMKLPELPKEVIFCPNCGERLGGEDET